MDIYCETHEKVTKINKNKFSERDLCKSLAIANALELLKLVFLSTSSGSDVQASLAATLQLYSESEIFTAFSFLKEKNYMVSICELNVFIDVSILFYLFMLCHLNHISS
jgi:general transcription factor 3C polypeptide 1